MAIVKKSRSRAQFVMNAFAILVTIVPIVTLSWTLVDALKPDPRQTTQLATIAQATDVRPFEEPLVTVTFDDGWESIYSQAAPLMSEHQIASTQYILPSQFNEKAYISVDQAKSLKQAGHEITSHTYTHPNLTTLSDKQVVYELDTSVKVLRKFTLADDGSLNFAAPEGKVNPQVMQLVKSRFGSARNVRGDIGNGMSSDDVNTPEKFDRYNIIGYSVAQYTKDEDFAAVLAYAREHNAWFIPVYHQIDESGDTYSVSPATFERHMLMIKKSNIQTATMRDVMKSLE